MATVDHIGLGGNDNWVCPDCEGQGMRIVEDELGRRVAVRCGCYLSRSQQASLRRANIPPHYQDCNLESFDVWGPNKKLRAKALNAAQKLVGGFPTENKGVGLLIWGSSGTGKTHFAAGILQALLSKGAEGFFCEYVDLVRRIQDGYSKGVAESLLLSPLLKAPVLVLDELGATPPTEWIYDTLSLILNKRYNEKLITIVTTNYPNLPPAAIDPDLPPSEQRKRELKQAGTSRTLGDRIGARMFSRLQEMCVSIELQGEDYRSTIKAARLT